eukprot:Em0002g3a
MHTGVLSWGIQSSAGAGGDGDRRRAVTTLHLEGEVGCVLDSAHQTSTVMYVISLGVCAGYRQRGVASFLMQSLMHHVSRIPTCDVIYLHVLSTNLSAIIDIAHSTRYGDGVKIWWWCQDMVVVSRCGGGVKMWWCQDMVVVSRCGGGVKMCGGVKIWWWCQDVVVVLRYGGGVKIWWCQDMVVSRYGGGVKMWWWYQEFNTLASEVKCLRVIERRNLSIPSKADDILSQENKAKARARYKADPEKKKASVRDSYKADPEKKKASVRDSYKADPEKKKASVRDSYKADPEKKKASVRDSYKAYPEKKKASVRDSYKADPERRRPLYATATKPIPKRKGLCSDTKRTFEENRAAKRQTRDNSAAIKASEKESMEYARFFEEDLKDEYILRLLFHSHSHAPPPPPLLEAVLPPPPAVAAALSPPPAAAELPSPAVAAGCPRRYQH